MSDRKYRQRGYQDAGARERDQARAKPGDAGGDKPRTHDRPEGPRTPNMPGFRTVVRCHRCGHVTDGAILSAATCAKCASPLHCCAQCESFNPAARFECMQSISVRVAPKDAFNACGLFAARTTVERETGSVRQTTSRSAFDDLFKI
ncbi:MAG: hypothetical protein WCP29_12995 [Acidobacteriota bacterium]